MELVRDCVCHDLMSGENRWLVADALIEIEKQPVEVKDFGKFTDHLRGIYKIYLKRMKVKSEDISRYPVWI